MNRCPTTRLLPLAAFTVALLVAGAARAEKPATDDEVTTPESVGFELGSFVLKDFRPIQGEKVRLSFTLHASTAAGKAKVFERRLEARQMRLRDQVITAMRLADPQEFEDPELRLIRRRLQLRLARALPELAIEGLFFSDLRYLVN